MTVAFEPPHKQFAYAKTKAQISFSVTVKLISAFVFATRIVQFLFYLNPKFQASRSFLLLCRPVCVGPVRKPHCWFSHEAAHLMSLGHGKQQWFCPDVNWVLRIKLNDFFTVRRCHYKHGFDFEDVVYLSMQQM